MTNELTTTTNYELQLKADEAIKAFDLLPVNETTRADYKARIGLYVDFINQHGLNRNTLLDYRRYLDSRTDYSVSTKTSILRVLNAIRAYYIRRGYYL